MEDHRAGREPDLALRGAAIGLTALGLLALLGGEGSLVSRRAPEPGRIASLLPPDPPPASSLVPDVDALRAAMVIPDPVRASPERRRRPVEDGLGGLGLGDGGRGGSGAGPGGYGFRGWCSRICVWHEEPGMEPFGLLDRGPGERLAHRSVGEPVELARESLAAVDKTGPDLGQVVRAHRDEVRACYVTQGLASDPGLVGHLSLALVVGGDGRVDQATVVDSTMTVAAVDRCIERRALRWRFPRSGRTTTLSYPLSFSPYGLAGRSATGP